MWLRSLKVHTLVIWLAWSSLTVSVTFTVDVTTCGGPSAPVGGLLALNTAVQDAAQEAMTLYENLVTYYTTRAGGGPRSLLDVAIDQYSLSLFGEQQYVAAAISNINQMVKSNQAVKIFCNDATLFRNYPDPENYPTDPQPGTTTAGFLFMPANLLYIEPTRCGQTIPGQPGSPGAYTVVGVTDPFVNVVLCIDQGFTNRPSAQLTPGSYIVGTPISQLQTVSWIFAHELGHSLLPNTVTDQSTVTGVTAYGWLNCNTLRGTNPELTPVNCDSLGYFAAGLYVIQRTNLDWSTGIARAIPDTWTYPGA